MIEIEFGKPGPGYNCRFDEIEKLRIIHEQIKFLELLPITFKKEFDKEFGEDKE